MEALAVKSSEVRKHFSEFIDNAIHKRPQVVARKRDHIIAMNTDHLAVVLKEVTLTSRITMDEEGKFISTLDEIDDLIGYGEHEGESLLNLATDLIEYAHDYMTESFTSYFNAPNRKKHLPYVFKVMLFDTPEEVLSLFRVEH